MTRYWTGSTQATVRGVRRRSLKSSTAFTTCELKKGHNANRHRLGSLVAPIQMVFGKESTNFTAISQSTLFTLFSSQRDQPRKFTGFRSAARNTCT